MCQIYCVKVRASLLRVRSALYYAAGKSIRERHSAHGGERRVLRWGLGRVPSEGFDGRTRWQVGDTSRGERPARFSQMVLDGVHFTNFAPWAL